jgi:DNA (cytosine-5)-methyltransferase 1
MKSLEIFSGAGGLAKGLELAGFHHAGFVEFNKDACASLKSNFDASKVFHGDIQEYDFSGLSNIDIVAGGPPCQPFSLGGKHKANQDHRDMFPYAINAINRLTPKAFIFENVKGLLRSSFSDYFEYILLRLMFPHHKIKFGMEWPNHLNELKKINYDSYIGAKYKVSYRLINTANYGVPQRRERVVIIGIRSDIDKDWIFPEPTHSEDELLRDMYVTGKYWEKHKIRQSSFDTLPPALKTKVGWLKGQTSMFEINRLPWLTVRDALSNVPDPRDNHNIADHIFRDGARVYAGHTGSDYDWPAKTIKAGGHGVPGGENMIRFPDGSVRYFTVFEAKKLQTFPDNFIITGTWGEALRQIGNAVPVALAEKLGVALWDLLNDGPTSPNHSLPKYIGAYS